MKRTLRLHAMDWAILSALALAVAPGPTASAAGVEQYNVTWGSPAKDFHGAIPLGNGDVGVSAWAEENGDLLFYISKTDAYDDNHRLLKLGRVRVKLTPNPFAKGLPFRQELKLQAGELTIHAGKDDSAVMCRLWVDANQPVIRVEVEGEQPVQADTTFETWRTSQRNIDGELSHSDPLRGSGQPTIQEPDVVDRSTKNRITWYRHNAHSVWPITMKLQGLESAMAGAVDPLLDRTFGGAITGDPPINGNWRGAQKKHLISVHVLTTHPAAPQEWLRTLDAQIVQVDKTPLEEARAAHRKWWEQFWNRSWVRVSGPDKRLVAMSRGYALQRYMMACGGRGNMWVKFNGSIFTLPYEKSDPDYRRWAGGQWFQNARLGYWPCIAAGDYDVTAPWFRQYVQNLPMARQRTRIYYKHEGAFFPETQLLWGAYANPDYGWDRRNVPLGLATNSYITYYWSSCLELTTMMLDQYDNTQDRAFLKETLLPLAGAFLEFYDQHWKRGPDGKILFEPAASLETWHAATNPLPEIAALQFIIPRMLALPEDVTSEAQRSAWRKTLAALPPVPTRNEGGKKFLLPAEKYSRKANVENPELYAVFPYRLYGVARADLPVAIETFNRRQHRENRCWWQCDVQAACLGLTATAANNVLGRLCSYNTAFAFPAMWGPHNDEIPDMDHGGNGQMALQAMLVQCDGKKILLFPAWPKEWDVEFKLHAPLNTTVEGVYRQGKVVELKVTPESRAADVVKIGPG